MSNNRNHVLVSEFEAWHDGMKISAMEFFAIRYVEDVLPTKKEIEYLEKHFLDGDDCQIVTLIKEQMQERGLI
jgi:hypothetical protein